MKDKLLLQTDCKMIEARVPNTSRDRSSSKLQFVSWTIFVPVLGRPQHLMDILRSFIYVWTV